MPASEPGLPGRRFELWRCPRCGSAVTAGAPVAELHQHGAYRPGRPRLHGLAGPLLRAFDGQRLALLGRVASPGARVLDAGAGQGRFVLRARAAGYDALGIDPYRGSAGPREDAGLVKAAGSAIQAVSIEEASIPAKSLGAVTLWHVLEHLENPRAGLERIAGWLEPGGGLLVGVPNLASLQARVGGERWYHLDVPRHRSHFTATGLSQLLNDTGFQVVAIEHRLLEHNTFGMWQSGLNRLSREPSWVYNVLKRNARFSARELALTALAVPLIPLAAATELAAGQARRGGTIAALARLRGAGGKAG
ncbi:MAG: methyltransferase domain-containing protein [Solirubrobacteraceae bacterium]